MPEHDPSKSRRHLNGPTPLAHRVLEVALLLHVAAGVLFFGGVHPAFQAAQALSALVLLGAYVVVGGLRGRLGVALSWPLAAAALLVGLGVAQVALGATDTPEETREALLRVGAAGVALLLASALARGEEAARRLALGLAALAAFEALYGIAERVSGHEHILFWPKVLRGAVSGTYVNRNHFAGALAILTPVVLGLALAEPSVWRRDVPRLRTRLAMAIDDPAFWRRTLLFAAAAVTGLAVCVSLSRGGVLALLAGLATTGLLATRGARGRLRAALWPLALAALTGTGLLAFGPDDLVRRFARISADSGAAEGSRLSFARASLSLVAERPLAGAGLGAFEQAHARVQEGWIGGLRVDHAHNDVLELAVEAGVPATLLVLLSVLLVARRALGATPTPLTIGIAGACVAGLAHALTDFGFQLSGTLSLAACALGVLAGPTAPRVGLTGGPARTAAIVGVGLLCALVPYPLSVWRAERLARPTVRAADDRRDPAARARDLDRAAAIRPAKAGYRLSLAEARADAFDDEVEEAANRLAASLAPGSEAQAGRALRAAILAARAGDERAVTEANLRDLRAALAVEPRNPRALAALARATADREEAFRASEDAVRAFPSGAEVHITAALARLRFDPQDTRAAAWLARGLALAPERSARAARAAIALGAETLLDDALPVTVDARRAYAEALLRAGRSDLAGAALDRLAALEEARTALAHIAPQAVSPTADTSTTTPLAVRPCDWLDRPQGRPLEALQALVLRLPPGRSAVTPLPAGGLLSLEASLLPGERAAFLCVLQDGRHRAHLRVEDGWRTDRLALPSQGLLEVAPAASRHRLGGLPPATVLVRDVSLGR